MTQRPENLDINATLENLNQQLATLAEQLRENSVQQGKFSNRSAATPSENRGSKAYLRVLNRAGKSMKTGAISTS